jgi:putative FmdB family regulatory protein
VPIFVYRCDCGHRFEKLVPRDAAAPACPECGHETCKMPAGPSLGRVGGGRVGGGRPAAQAGASGSRGDVPIPWRGVVAGGPEKLRREVEFRDRLEAKANSGLRVPGGPDSPSDKGSGAPPAAAPTSD